GADWRNHRRGQGDGEIPAALCNGQAARETCPMSRDHEPLDPEERALADALGRAVPRAGPPPAVDAAILASARRATQAPTGSGASHHRPRRRWPAVLGVAASLALAVG